MEQAYSDKEVIGLILAKTNADQDTALKYLYKTYYPLIRTFVLKNNGDNEDAADIFQDTLIVLFNQITKGLFRGDASIKTFIYAVARNSWLKELRKHPRQLLSNTVVEESEYLEEKEIFEFKTENKEDLLRNAFNQIGKDCREILIDYYYSRLSMREIMVKFGLGSEQAAKNKKYRCLKKLIKLCRQNGLNKY